MCRLSLSVILVLGLVGCGGSSGKTAGTDDNEVGETSTLSQAGLSPSAAQVFKPDNGLKFLRPPAS
jgi:hypothetical protein